ncbi:unnamed protein product, partial [Mesorhabditis belari]|uniref:RNase H type-1 domain-containing protein n=1 Tax=Mesorhabditis belari TaxID=2138241 RepID=A0AAF3EZM7_9BILA
MQNSEKANIHPQCMLVGSKREQLPDVPAVYFVAPNDENVELLCNDLKLGLYENFYRNFISPLSRPRPEILATAAVNGGAISQVQKVVDQYLNFISLEDDLFVLKRYPEASPMSYYAINDPSTSDAQMESMIESIADGLFSMCATLGLVPVIRASKDNAAEQIAIRLDQKLRDNLRDARNNHCLMSAFWNWVFGIREARRKARGTRPGADEDLKASDFSYEATKYGFDEAHGKDQDDTAFNETFPENTIVCYTDGSFQAGVPREAVDSSAYAGFFGEGNILNFAVRLEGLEKATLSNKKRIPEDDCATYIEIVAVKTALEKLAALPGSTDMDVIVRTDSMNTIQGLKKRNKLKIEDLRKGIDSIKKVVSNYPRGVLFQHVYSHNGDAGNEMADAMASRARKGCTSEKDYQLEEKLVKREKKYSRHGKVKSQYERAFNDEGNPTSKRYVFIKQNGEAEKRDE